MLSINWLAQHLEGFAADRRLKKRIDALFEFSNTRKRTGFENWFQYELVAHFIDANLDPKIEQAITEHGIRVDMLLTKGKGKNQEQLYIEIKVKRRVSSLIKRMKEDIEKLGQISFDSAHSRFAIGLTSNTDKIDVTEACKQAFDNDFRVIDVTRDSYIIAAEVN